MYSYKKMCMLINSYTYKIYHLIYILNYMPNFFYLKILKKYINTMLHDL